MTKAEPVTGNFIRYRLTDPVSGVDNWRAEAFGLLVAERFYPDLVTCFDDVRSDTYGFFRNRLNRVWAALQEPSSRMLRQITERDLSMIAQRIPDNRQDGALGARAVAAGTICMHLTRFVQSGDRDDIARLAFAACAGAAYQPLAEADSNDTPWPMSIPFDEVGTYDAAIEHAPGVQSELRLQKAELEFVEMLGGSVQQRCEAVLRRAFVEPAVRRT